VSLSAYDYFPQSDQFTALMDCSIELTRDCAGWFVPAYIVANTPLALALIVGLNAIGSRSAALALMGAGLAIMAFLWRWVVLTMAQRRLLRILSPSISVPPWRRMWSIIVIKFMLCGIGISAACVGFIPSMASLIGSTMAAPFILDQHKVNFASASHLIRVPYSMPRILAGLYGLALVYGLFSGAAYLLLELIAKPILPSFLGIHDMHLQLIVSSRAFGLTVLVLCLVPLDMFWIVAGVILSQRIGFLQTGADLKARLLIIAGDVPS